jgi:Cu(I)/Ag(I) efflux system membrane protein CusA/SilA
MAAAALLSITLIPVLMGWLIRGSIPAEDANPINRFLTRIYRPRSIGCWPSPKQALLIAGLVFATSLWPISQTGGEFMPQMNEGDLLYMPSALPGISTAKASMLLQQTDRLIKTVPEVESVFGKAGRADTATDPAPLEMFETTIRFKPKSEWRSRHDAGKADRRTGPHRQSPRPRQFLDTADPQPHRYAGHRHQKPDRGQGVRREPRRH